MNKQMFLTIHSSLAALALIAGCASQKDHNAARSRPAEPFRYGEFASQKGTHPDRYVVTPPNGYPGAMSTVEEERTRVGWNSEKAHPKAPAPTMKAEAAPSVTAPAPAAPEGGVVMSEPEFVSRNAAPAPMHKHRHTVAVMKPVPAHIARLREVEALNRLHHVNQTEIALADLALSKSVSPALQARAKQSKAASEQMDVRVKILADKRKIRLEKFSPATYEAAVNRQLNATEATDFDSAFMAATNRAHKDAFFQLAVARGEVRNHEVIVLIKSERPMLQAYSFRPTPNKARASESSEELGQ